MCNSSKQFSNDEDHEYASKLNKAGITISLSRLTVYVCNEYCRLRCFSGPFLIKREKHSMTDKMTEIILDRGILLLCGFIGDHW